MGVAIRCVLEREIPDLPFMEGKCLAMAYCSAAADDDGSDSESAGGDIISLDFSGSGSKTQSSSRREPTQPAGGSLFDALTPFIAGDRGADWHDARAGLVAVRAILAKLNDGATVTLDPDFPFGPEESEELTDDVRNDLEDLENILTAAERAGARFYLTIDA